MKKYNVTVNGTSYEITLEVVDEKDIKASAPAPAAAPSPAAPAPAPAPVANANGETVVSPMPGNILAVNVQNGSAVKKGDVLMVLEAMKMENEIMAPKAGTVTQVAVSKGSTVETGAPLVYIK